MLLASCSSTDDFCLLGYSTRSQYSREIRTVYVPIFKNRTYVRGIEFQLTEAVIKQIESKTPWKVVNDPNAADAELLVTIMTAPKRVITQHQLSEIREGEITLGVEVCWRDCRTGQPFGVAENNEPVPLVAVPGLPAPEPGKKLIVQRSAAFIPELGESVATAKMEVVNDLAEQIVSMLETPW